MEASLSAALASGLTVEGFYSSTPYLTRLQVEGAARVRLSQAWHTEAMARTERLPALADLLADEDDDPTGLAADHEVRQWAAGWGLTFETVH